MKWYQNTSLGILIFRLLIGFAFIMHGWPKLIGGPERWEKIGSAMSNMGISFAPEFWGLCAALAEFGGGLLLITGLFFRPACAFLVFTMFIAALKGYTAGSGAYLDFSYPAEIGAVLLAFFFIGPGKHTLTQLFTKK